MDWNRQSKRAHSCCTLLFSIKIWKIPQIMKWKGMFDTSATTKRFADIRSVRDVKIHVGLLFLCTNYMSSLTAKRVTTFYSWSAVDTWMRTHRNARSLSNKLKMTCVVDVLMAFHILTMWAGNSTNWPISLPEHNFTRNRLVRVFEWIENGNIPRSYPRSALDSRSATKKYVKTISTILNGAGTENNDLTRS